MALPIVQNDSLQLIAEQSAPGGMIFAVLGCLGLFVGAYIFFRLRLMLGAVLAIILGIVIGYFSIPSTSYKVIVNKTTGAIGSATLHWGKQISYSEVAAKDLSSAELRFN